MTGPHVIRLRVDGEEVAHRFPTLAVMQEWLREDGPDREHPQGYEFLSYRREASK